MKAYTYHPSTKEYLSEIEVQESPLEPGRYMTPPNCVDIAPVSEEGKARVWDGNEWLLIDDNRGTIVYNTATKEKTMWKLLGEIPKEYTTSLPPDDPQYCTWDSTKWTVDTTAKEKDIAKQSLADTDKYMARITEDLIDILISKKIISESDIPKSVSDKLNERKVLRSKIQ